MNRRVLRQVALGLAVGVAVPLAVVAILLAVRDGHEAGTVVVSPSPEATVAGRGLKATTGRQLLPYLLTAKDLGSGWRAAPSGEALGRGDLAQAVPELELPDDCAGYYGAQSGALSTAFAQAAYFKAGADFFSEMLYVFRPGLAQESMAFLRGLAIRCGKRSERLTLPGGRRVTISYETKVAEAPRLGEETLRLVTTSRNASPRDETFVRVGDTVLRCVMFTAREDLVKRAYDKIW